MKAIKKLPLDVRIEQTTNATVPSRACPSFQSWTIVSAELSSTLCRNCMFPVSFSNLAAAFIVSQQTVIKRTVNSRHWNVIFLFAPWTQAMKMLLKKRQDKKIMMEIISFMCLFYALVSLGCPWDCAPGQRWRQNFNSSSIKLEQ